MSGKMSRIRGYGGDALVDWLNQEAPSDYGRNSQASRNRVLELRAAIATVLKSLSGRKRGVAPEDVRAAQKKIEAAVALYPPVREVELRAAHGIGKWGFRSVVTPGIPYGERSAVWCLFEIANNSAFKLLRQCDCGRWFFAKREDSAGCSASCNRKALEKTEAFKEYRRKYMRGYYALKNSGKVK
jgi:hypothetical protein